MSSDSTRSRYAVLPPVVRVVAGYMGDESDWCYFETLYPEDGSVGPFSCREAAEQHAKANGFSLMEWS